MFVSIKVRVCCLLLLLVLTVSACNSSGCDEPQDKNAPDVYEEVPQEQGDAQESPAEPSTELTGNSEIENSPQPELSEPEPFAALRDLPDPPNILGAYTGDTTIRGEDVVAEVAAIMTDFVPDFRIEDYNAHVYEGSDIHTTIDYVRKIDGFETNSAFVAMITDHDLVAVYDNSIPISEEEISRVRKLGKKLGIPENTDSLTEKNQPKELTEALSLAWEETDASSAKEPINQRYFFYYEIETKSACILVNTEYYFDGTDAIGLDVYTYALTN